MSYPKTKFHPAGGSITVHDAHQEKAHPEFTLSQDPRPVDASAERKAAKAKVDAEAKSKTAAE